MSIKPDDGLLYSAPHILSMTYFVPVYLVHRIEAAGCIPPPGTPRKVHYTIWQPAQGYDYPTPY